MMNFPGPSAYAGVPKAHAKKEKSLSDTVQSFTAKLEVATADLEKLKEDTQAVNSHVQNTLRAQQSMAAYGLEVCSELPNLHIHRILEDIDGSDTQKGTKHNQVKLDPATKRVLPGHSSAVSSFVPFNEHHADVHVELQSSDRASLPCGVTRCGGTISRVNDHCKLYVVHDDIKFVRGIRQFTAENTTGIHLSVWLWSDSLEPTHWPTLEEYNNAVAQLFGEQCVPLARGAGESKEPDGWVDDPDMVWVMEALEHAAQQHPSSNFRVAARILASNILSENACLEDLMGGVQKLAIAREAVDMMPRSKYDKKSSWVVQIQDLKKQLQEMEQVGISHGYILCWKGEMSSIA
jgi:hypothetical protein